MEDTGSDRAPTPVYLVSSSAKADDIDLVVLWTMFARRKWLIIACTLAAVLLGGSYAYFIADPVYRADIRLLPPTTKDIQGLLFEKSRQQGKGYTQDEVYGEFLKLLYSRSFRRQFFDNHDLIDHYLSGKSKNAVNLDKLFSDEFDDNLQVQPEAGEQSSVIVSFAGSDARRITDWLNQFVSEANTHAIKSLVADVEAEIKAEIVEIREKVSSKLQLAEQRRADEIVRLQEALQVAKALGIEKTVEFSVAAGESRVEVAGNTSSSPLYMRGERALAKEIEVLVSRKSEAPFVAGLRDLQERLAYLESFSIQPDQVSAVAIDAAATVPYELEEPRKAKILLLATLLGMVCGIGLAVANEISLQSRRRT